MTKYDIDRVTLVLPSSHESNGVTLTLKWVGSKCIKQCMMITVITTHEVTRQCFKSEHQNETYREICIYNVLSQNIRMRHTEKSAFIGIPRNILM